MASDVGDLRRVSIIPWGAGLDPVVADTGPLPGAAAFETGGPSRVPARTWMELCVGPGGVAGLLVDPDGGHRPLAVGPGPALVTLPSVALAVAPRTDGVWSLTADGLEAIRTDGTVVERTPHTGLRLLSAPDDAVWVLDQERARRVAADGTVTADVPWPDPFNACVTGNSLCGWDSERPTGVIRVAADGARTSGDVEAEREQFERPLALETRRVAGSVLNTLVVRSATGPPTSVTVRGAGLDSAGEAFLAVEREDRGLLLRPGSAPVELPGGIVVLAVDGDRVLARTHTHAEWLEKPAVPAEPLDEDRYRAEVFPVAWTVPTPYPLVVTPDGEFMVAASGPAGLVVVGFRA